MKKELLKKRFWNVVIICGSSALLQIILIRVLSIGNVFWKIGTIEELTTELIITLFIYLIVSVIVIAILSGIAFGDD